MSVIEPHPSSVTLFVDAQKIVRTICRLFHFIISEFHF